MDESFEPKPLLTIREAAFAMGLSRSTIYELIADGDLVRLKIGNRALVTARSIHAYVERLEQEQAPSHVNLASDETDQSAPSDGPA